MKNILFINNRDSFAYNLIELLRQLNIEPRIIEDTIDATKVSGNYVKEKLLSAFKNADKLQINELSISDIINSFDGIILSPGAGVPKEYSIMQTILENNRKTPILGICLGHQAIAQTAGAKLKQMPKPLHGHTSRLIITQPIHPIFNSLTNETLIGRYHSWVVDNNSLPETLDIIALDNDGNIQAIADNQLPHIGLQFHPESIITTNGKEIIRNWLSYIDKNQ